MIPVARHGHHCLKPQTLRHLRYQQMLATRVDSAQSKPWSFSTPLRSVATRASSRCKRSASFAKALLLAKLKDSRRWTRFSDALERLAALAPLLPGAEIPNFKDGTYPG